MFIVLYCIIYTCIYVHTHTHTYTHTHVYTYICITYTYRERERERARERETHTHTHTHTDAALLERLAPLAALEVNGTDTGVAVCGKCVVMTCSNNGTDTGVDVVIMALTQVSMALTQS